MALDDAYSKVLLHFNGIDGSTTFVDESGKVWTAAGDAQLDTAQKVFGTASGKFDGTGDWITTPDHVDFDFGSGLFAIDFRARFNGSVPSEVYFCGHSIDTSNYIVFRIYGGELNFRCDISPTGEIINLSRAHSFVADTWYHVAFTFDGTDGRLFIAGTQLGAAEAAAGAMLNGTGVFAVGSAEYNGSFLTPLNGWIEEFRISKGTARWTANFTPPTAEYAPIPDIILDFASAPLTFTVSAAAEALFLDFSAAPLTFTPSIIFGFAEIDFADCPLEITLSASLSDMFDIDMGTAPLLITVSFDPAFEGRGSNRVSGNWPTPIISGKMESRSARAESTFPSFSLTAHVLAGEIIQVEGTWPSFEVAGAGHSNEIAHVSGYFPRFKIKGKIIGGNLAQASGSFPRFIIAASAFQTPRIAMAGTFPAFRIRAFASERVQILNRQYRATVLNLKNMAVTRYEDFDFNSLCYFNGVYLGANENGIYILGGDKEAGADISWSFKTPKIDFLNAIPADIWLSLRNSQALAVKVEQNEDLEHPYTYAIEADTGPLIHMERVKLGRGLEARVMQMTVSGTGKIDLNGISIVTNPLKKSKR